MSARRCSGPSPAYPAATWLARRAGSPGHVDHRPPRGKSSPRTAAEVSVVAPICDVIGARGSFHRGIVRGSRDRGHQVDDHVRLGRGVDLDLTICGDAHGRRVRDQLARRIAQSGDRRLRRIRSEDGERALRRRSERHDVRHDSRRPRLHRRGWQRDRSGRLGSEDAAGIARESYTRTGVRSRPVRPAPRSTPTRTPLIWVSPPAGVCRPRESMVPGG